MNHVFGGNPVERLELFLKATRGNFMKGLDVGVMETGRNISRLIMDMLRIYRLFNYIVGDENGSNFQHQTLEVIPGLFGGTSMYGKIVSWTPQTQVLGHASIGVPMICIPMFVTHCGANFVFESIANGVPMICIPMFGDHTKSGVLKSLELILGDERGRKIRERIRAHRELVLKAAEPTGTFVFIFSSHSFAYSSRFSQVLFHIYSHFQKINSLKEVQFEMSFLAVVKFALICFDAFAWHLFALGYPLRASIQAIEANSNSDTKKLVTYWVIFSLISLFEYAFMGILQWLPFWPYMKLTIVCWMMIPNFDGAFYVYDHIVHPFLCIDVQTVINWFKKQQEFVLKDKFLADADKYVTANGPEALEKLIASKGTEPIILQKDIKPVQVTEKREVAPVNLIPEIEPNAAQTVNNIITPEVKGAAGCHSPEIPADEQVQKVKGAAGCHSPEIPADKQVQKEWTCALCQVTTTSENCLNSHLQGRRHKDACEALMKAKNQPSKGKVSSASAVRVKHSDLPNEEPQKRASSSSAQASQMKQQSSVARNKDLPSNNTSTSSKAVTPKAGTSKSYLPREEPKKMVPNKMAGNQLKAGENVRGQQQVQKKNAETKIPQFRCIICNISCTRSEDLNCHLWGRKHLARIQELNKS
ncbi:hypothetical protein DITRI_Ditri01bG0083100 [Diplodiscus trichospermus]